MAHEKAVSVLQVSLKQEQCVSKKINISRRGEYKTGKFLAALACGPPSTTMAARASLSLETEEISCSENCKKKSYERKCVCGVVVAECFQEMLKRELREIS